MSIPAETEILKNLNKPFLKYKIGEIVYLTIDLEFKNPMLIIDYELEDINCNDYYCRWLNSQGKPETEAYPEEVLTTKK